MPELKLVPPAAKKRKESASRPAVEHGGGLLLGQAFHEQEREHEPALAIERRERAVDALRGLAAGGAKHAGGALGAVHDAFRSSALFTLRTSCSRRNGLANVACTP